MIDGVNKPEKIKHSLSKEISPDGATVKDICVKLERCIKDNCKRYHPKWAEGVCIKFIKGKCTYTKCTLNHNLTWSSLISEAISYSTSQYDVITGLNF